MSDIPMKKCTGPCGQEYPATTEFWYRRQKSKDGWQIQCKDCQKNYKKLPGVKERERDYHKEYNKRIEAKEKIRAYLKLPEVQEKKREYDKDYYSRIEIRKSRRIYRNMPEIKEKNRKRQLMYYSRPEMQEQSKSYARNRRARKKTVSGTHTPAQIQDQLKRQRHKCYYCQARLKKAKGKYIYHIEHTFPLSRVVGTDIPANSIDYLVLACPSCNLSKHDKFPWEFPEGGRLL